MAADIWVNATLAIAGTSIPTLVSNPSLQLNKREVVLANGTAPAALFGYAPGQAKSGFSVRTNAFTGNAASICNSMLGTAGVTIAMQLGTTGGASMATCFCTQLELTGTENGDILLNADFETINPPSIGGTVATATGYGQSFYFSDVTHLVLPGGTKTAVNRFSYKVMRRLARYQGNSPYGLPQSLKPVVTTVSLDAEYEKLDDSEPTAFSPTCPTLTDCSVLITQVCGGAATLTLVAQQSFHSIYPQAVGSSVEDYIKESCQLLANKGGFSIS